MRKWLKENWFVFAFFVPFLGVVLFHVREDAEFGQTVNLSGCQVRVLVYPKEKVVRFGGLITLTTVSQKDGCLQSHICVSGPKRAPIYLERPATSEEVKLWRTFFSG